MYDKTHYNKKIKIKIKKKKKNLVSGRMLVLLVQDRVKFQDSNFYMSCGQEFPHYSRLPIRLSWANMTRSFVNSNRSDSKSLFLNKKAGSPHFAWYSRTMKVIVNPILWGVVFNSENATVLQFLKIFAKMLKAYYQLQIHQVRKSSKINTYLVQCELKILETLRIKALYFFFN